MLFFGSTTVYGQGGLVDSIRTRYDTISYWTRGGNVSLTFQQLGLKNWTAGGDELLAFNFDFSGFANKEMERYIWFNQIDASYSLSRQGEIKTIRANKDRWRISSRISRKLENNWLLTFGMVLQSQFGRLYKVSVNQDTNEEVAVLTSNAFSPGYVWPSLGFTYSKKNHYNVSLMPINGKVTIVLDDSLSAAGAFGVDEGRNFRSETGIGIGASIKQPIIKNITIESELSTFSRYRDLLFTDVRWDFTLRFKVNQYVSGFYTSNFIYDKDVVDEIQFRYSINIGFSYDIPI